jgi:hypothetical protein
MVSGTYYLYRQRLLQPTQSSGRCSPGSLHSHNRPVPTLPALKGPDTPASRVTTVVESDRVAYAGTFDPNFPPTAECPCTS